MATSLRRKSKNNSLGAFGESVVANFLLDHGSEIIERNWRIKEGEIDLISLDRNKVFAFVEVKTRSSLSFGHPLEAISPEKLRRIQRLALAWLVTHQSFGCEYTIDCAAVLLAKDGTYTIDYRADVR
ncbi:MAG: YraN family protein [Actinomycetota bacterium]